MKKAHKFNSEHAKACLVLMRAIKRLRPEDHTSLAHEQWIELVEKAGRWLQGQYGYTLPMFYAQCLGEVLSPEDE